MRRVTKASERDRQRREKEKGRKGGKEKGVNREESSEEDRERVDSFAKLLSRARPLSPPFLQGTPTPSSEKRIFTRKSSKLPGPPTPSERPMPTLIPPSKTLIPPAWPPPSIAANRFDITPPERRPGGGGGPRGRADVMLAPRRGRGRGRPERLDGSLYTLKI